MRNPIRPDQVRGKVTRYRDGEFREDIDVVAAEEPMEIRINWVENGEPQRKSLTITMRTPGDDFELATGFLFAESVIRGQSDIEEITYREEKTEKCNIVSVALRAGIVLDTSRLERSFVTNSSCGVCGKATLSSLELQGCTPLAGDFRVLREAQAVFETTGGLHAAGLFRNDGTLIELKEDVGRHNALDKLIGSRVMHGYAPLDDSMLMLSGRASFELLQKAIVAGIPVVAAVGAPSSLAVNLAKSFNITLAGFLRANSFNIYANPARITA
jgi:FdhD protein